MTTMGVWLFGVYALAVARLSVLITLDEITRPPREALTEWLDARTAKDEHWLSALATCPWCSSIYIAAAAAPLAYWHGANPWLLVPALALAFSFVAGALSNLGRE